MSGAFTLAEVVIAVGIFTVGIVVVLGLFPPIAESARYSREAGSAVDAVELLFSRLRSEPMPVVAGYLKTADEFLRDEERPDYDPLLDDRMFHASREGDWVGRRNEPGPGGGVADGYFEMMLIRNEELSPARNDDTAGWLAFNVRVRWPAFPGAAGGDGSAVTRKMDPGLIQMLVFARSVRR